MRNGAAQFVLKERVSRVLGEIEQSRTKMINALGMRTTQDELEESLQEIIKYHGDDCEACRKAARLLER